MRIAVNIGHVFVEAGPTLSTIEIPDPVEETLRYPKNTVLAWHRVANNVQYAE